MALANEILDTEFANPRHKPIAKAELDLGDYALTQKGASASTNANHEPDADYPADSAINGDKTHKNWGATSNPRGGWKSGDIDVHGNAEFTIDFGEDKIINRLEIFTYPKDALNDAIVDTQLTAFEIQTKPDGGAFSAWSNLEDGGGGDGSCTIASGVVSANTRTWNIFTSSTERTCRYIKLIITVVADTHYARICEIEAYRSIDLTENAYITAKDFETGDVAQMSQNRLVDGRVTRRKDFNFNKFVAGQATLNLRNEDRKFSPSYQPTVDETTNQGYFNREIRPELRLRIWEGFDQLGREELVQTGIFYVKTWDASSQPKQVTVTMRDRTCRLLRKIFDGPTTILENYEVEKLIEWVALRMNISVDEMDLATSNTQIPYFFPKDREAWEIIQDLAESLGFAAVFFNEEGKLKYEYYLTTLPHEKAYGTIASGKDDWDLGTLKPPASLDSAINPGSLQLKYSTFLIDDFTDGDHTNNPTWTVISGAPSVSQHKLRLDLLGEGVGGEEKIRLDQAFGNYGTFHWDTFGPSTIGTYRDVTLKHYFLKAATDDGYGIELETNYVSASGPVLNRKVRIVKVVAGTPNTLVEQDLGETSAFTSHYFRLDIEPNRVRLRINWGPSGDPAVDIESSDTTYRDFDRLDVALKNDIVDQASNQFYRCDNYYFYLGPTYVQDQNWDGPGTGTESLRGMTEIDWMEYANDAAAQAAWVSSKPPTFARDNCNNASIDPFWTVSTNGSGTVVEDGGGVIAFAGADSIDDCNIIYGDLPATFDFTFKYRMTNNVSDGSFWGIFDDTFAGVATAGSVNPQRCVCIQAGTTGGYNIYIQRLTGGVPKAWKESGGGSWEAWPGTEPYVGAQNIWYVFRFVRDANDVHVYLYAYAADDTDYTLEVPLRHAITDRDDVDDGDDNGHMVIGGDAYTNAHAANAEIDWIEGLYGDLLDNLQSYFNDTEEQQGTFCLKVVAEQTNSLNERIERDLGGGGTLDWSGKDVVSVWVRASRTGTNFAFYFGEDAWDDKGPYNITINVADTWERKLLDISGVADADKNAVRYLAIKITNADAINTIYLDALGFYEYTKLGQQFTPSSDNAVGKISLNLTKIGSPSGNVWVEIHTDDGTNEPSEVIRATSETVACADIAAGPGWIDFEFLNLPLNTNANLYHVVLKADYDYSILNYIDWNFDDAAPTYSGGDGSYYAEGADDWATFTDQDFLFREYYISAGFPISEIHEGWWIGPNTDTGVATPTKWDPFEFDFSRNEATKADVHIKLFTQVAPDDAGSPGVWDDYLEIAGWDGADYIYKGTQLPQSALKQWIRPIVYFRGLKRFPFHWTPLLHWIRLNWWTGGGNTVPSKSYDLLENGTLLNAKIRFASEEGGRGKIYKRAIVKAKRRYRQSYEDVWEFQENITLINGDDVTYNVDLDDPCQPDTTGAHQMELYVDETNDATFNPATEIDDDGNGTDNTSVANLTVTYTRHPTKPTIRLVASGNVNLYGMKIRAKPYKIVAPIEAIAEASDLNRVDYEGEDLPYENEFLATRAIAEAIASDVIENASTEEAYLVNTSIRNCPALQIGDVVYMKEHHLGINHYFQIFGYNRPLGKTSMTITARRTSFRGLETPGAS